MGRLFLILIFTNALVSAQVIPHAIVNSGNSNEFVYFSPDDRSRIVTEVTPEVKMVAIDSVLGWYKINIPFDGLGSVAIGWVKSGKEHFTSDFSNDFVELTNTKVVLRSEPGGALKPFSIVWIDADGDRNYSSTIKGQYYAVKDYRKLEDELWFRVFVTNNCKSFKDEKLSTTIYGWLPEKYVRYHYSYNNKRNKIKIEELDKKYEDEKSVSQHQKQEIENIKIKNLLLASIVALLLITLLIYVILVNRKKKKENSDKKFSDKMNEKYNLTNANIEIWQLLEKGLTEKQIAKRLFLSLEAVRSRRSALYKKLEAHNPKFDKLNKTRAGNLYRSEIEVFMRQTYRK